MNETKKCAGCGLVKPKEDFSKRSAKPCGVQSRCRKCLSQYHKQRREDRPALYAEYARREHFKANYGITLDDYDAMLLNQESKCAGCGRCSSEMKRRLDVDHCHKTGKVRGLLCPACNRAIGYGQDSPMPIYVCLPRCWLGRSSVLRGRPFFLAILHLYVGIRLSSQSGGSDKAK